MPLAGEPFAWHRGLCVLRGTPAQTATQAAALGPDLWLGEADGAPVSAHPVHLTRKWLGTDAHTVVVDLHRGVHADALAAAVGLVRGGGQLVLRVPPEGEDPCGTGSLPAHATHHFYRRVVRSLAVAAGVCAVRAQQPGGLGEQDALLEALVADLASAGPPVVLTARRGRGKSAGLGRVLARLVAVPGWRREQVVVTGPGPAATATLRTFSGGVPHTHPGAVSEALSTHPRLLVVDEAAGLALPTLQSWVVAAGTHTRIVFATTTEGYEGTGRGFRLRFVPWLSARGPVHTASLDRPIRWAPGCPLEAWSRRLFLADATVAAAVEEGGADTEIAWVSPAELAVQDELLHGVFGLLTSAHYRTTPGDLSRLLDAPGTQLVVARRGRTVVGVVWLVAEGRLDPKLLAAGHRPRGHALPDTLACHAGRPDAAALSMWRSVRTAVHPTARRQGVARALVAAVHERARGQVDLVGTLFSLNPGVVAFRRALGYRLVRLGTACSARTGAPSVVMIHPLSAAAHHLVAHLQAALSRDAAFLAAHLEREPGFAVDSDDLQGILVDLPTARPWTLPEARARVEQVVHGAMPTDSAAGALAAWCGAHPAVAMLELPARAVVVSRLGLGDDPPLSWHETTRHVGLASVRATQRALRRALAVLLDHPDAPGG